MVKIEESCRIASLVRGGRVTSSMIVGSFGYSRCSLVCPSKNWVNLANDLHSGWLWFGKIKLQALFLALRLLGG